ncbi:MAG: extracellular solute-binding protein [Lachnospiraceae bacterium]|jgi:arabinogalactan oligomer/maltooligosaccharide transport system substrate-binding protein|nr:extracellular solute-binding protein [Lachnospiraceae bacterium]MCI9357304.1 extracellular solute-binding protein [Lachnospiraceae bacterium]
MKRKIRLWLSLFLLAILMSGCQKSDSKLLEEEQKPDSDTVNLTVWGAEEDEELLSQIIDGFQSEYSGQAEFLITYMPQSESKCMDALMADLEQGADVFAFADDQLNALVAAGALEPVENPESFKQSNLPEAVLAASVNDTLYALPLTADNGYFLYYNKQYFSEEDIASFDRMQDIAAEHGKKVSMEWSSGWYVYSLFGSTGLTVGLNDDGITNYCTWNSTEGEIKGTDVAQAMTAMAGHPGFISTDDAGFLEGVKNGTIIAGINGVWNAVAVEEAWGSNFGAAKLPSYTCAGREVQMTSFSGYKLIGVNAYSKHRKWAARLAEWIANEKNQKLRFQMRGQGPSNRNAASSEEVQNSPAIAALLEQAEYSCLQRIGGNFWEPVSVFTANILEGNPAGESLQEQLDTMVEGITAP